VESGSLIADRYRLLRRIGEGAMGVVWAATNVFTDRVVALKLIPRGAIAGSELRARMLREARACGRIQHRNVVEIYDVGQTSDGDPFLVMQLLRGETLEQRMRREGAMPTEAAVSIALSIARALAAAHAAGIVHRDLKPANVFLHREPGEREAIVKVLDFGVSKVLGGDPTEATVTGNVIGSPAYMSPEQARGASNLEPRSDVWAFGAVLFEMVAGRIAFRGETAYEAVGEILHGQIPRLSSVDPTVHPRIDAIVASCLQRDVSMRPTAGALVHSLEAIAQGVPARVVRIEPNLEVAEPDTRPRSAAASATSTTPMLRPSHELPLARSRRFLIAGLAIGAFGVFSALVGAWFSTRAPTPTTTNESPAPARASSAPSASQSDIPITATTAEPSAHDAPADASAPSANPATRTKLRTPAPPKFKDAPIIPESPG